MAARRDAWWCLPLCAAGAVLALAWATPAGMNPPRCPGGRFLLPVGAGGLVAGGNTVTSDVIVLEETPGDRMVSLASGCEPKRGKIWATRLGTVVRVRWPQCGTDRKVRLKARFETDCSILAGTVKAAKVPAKPFVATRSTCGDDRIDQDEGEECELSTPCTPDFDCETCRCVPGSGTTSSTAQVSTTSVPTTTATSTSAPPTTISPSTTSTTSSTSTTQPDVPPPDPETVAPPPVPGEITGFGAAAAFLRSTGIQLGADEGAFDARRVAVIRGKVLDVAGAPLPAVTITILDHPEFGRTLSRADGMFDLAVNGGGQLTVRYAKAGRLPAQRSVDAPWTDWVMTPDVVLLAAAPMAAAFQGGAPEVQEAAAEVESDARGTRQAFLIIPPGTTAEMVLPDGTTQPLATFHVRAKEYTVGERGPEAMPAGLPPSSGYTYAVDYGVDEAVAAGAREVRFSQPVIHYLENFLGFPVGTAVPSGSYDATRGQWMANPNGRVVQVTGSTGGLADLDVTGDGLPDDGAVLAELGLTDGERARLAMRYGVGQSLWRVPLAHFSPYDHNWPYGPGPGDVPPNGEPPKGDPPPDRDDPCKKNGSVIECQNQVLGEDIPLVGTPLAIHYRSDRVRGRTAAGTIVIPLSGTNVSPTLKGITLEIDIAGQQIRDSFPPLPDQSYTFTWDRLDAWGRPAPGIQTAHVRVGYVYDLKYQQPSATFAWAALSGVPFGIDTSVLEFVLFQEWDVRITTSLDARLLGLGGWTFGVHHLYDAQGQLWRGDGRRRITTALGLSVVRTLVSRTIGGGGSNYAGRAVQSRPDGGLYVSNGCQIFLRSPEGTFQRVVGLESCGGPYSGDGLPALLMNFESSVTYGIAVGPDGSLYFPMRSRVLRVGPDQIVRTIAGTPTAGFSGDGGPATAAQLREVVAVALGPDGSLYLADASDHRVRRIGPEGRIETFAGTGGGLETGDGGPARDAQISLPRSIAVAPSGTVYIVTQGRVRRVGTDGIITTVPGVGNLSSCPPSNPFCGNAQAVAVGSDGILYVAEPEFVHRVLADGTVETVFGNGLPCYAESGEECGDNGPATATGASQLTSITLLPDGRIVVTDDPNRLLRAIGPALPGEQAGDLLVPGDDGTEVYRFDSDGRHLQTIDSLTNTVRWQFGYDAGGRLVTLTDGDANVTTIERDAGGDPTAIVAPGGQRTTVGLDADGYLAHVTDPGGQAITLAYHPEPASGLLATFTDRRGAVHQYGYDPMGRLTSDLRPARGTTTLVRTETALGHEVAVTTGAGLTTTYAVESLAGGVARRTATEPTGAVTESLVRPNGTQRVTYPDGTIVDLVEGPDPRWGMQVPLLRTLTITPPTGAPLTRTFARAATLDDLTNPLSLTTQTDTFVLSGATSTLSWDTAARTLMLTTPAGRQVTVETDALRRVTSQQLPNVDPLSLTWDPKGRVAAVAQGTQQVEFEYDTGNRLVARTDALGHRVELGYDTADRRTSTRLPSLRTWGFGWDGNRNLTEVTPPGVSAHALAYDAADGAIGYTPPGNPAYAFPRDVAGRPDAVSLPDTRSEQYAYDPGGRPTGITYDEAVVSVAYASGDPTDRPDAITRTPTGGGPAQQVEHDWNESLPTATRFTGPAEGAFDYQYDSAYRLQAIQLTSGADDVTTPYSYDADRLRMSIGAFTLTRNGPAGAPTEISDGTGTLVYGYDALGRIASRTLTVNGVIVYDADVQFDAAGWIASQTETDATGTHTVAYGWDEDGQLLQVLRDGGEVESYAYDDRGNRTSRSVSGGPAQPATFDAQDRLLARAAVIYASDAAGFLTQRGGDVFTYSAVGELLESTAGSGVTYGSDGLRRRVTRTHGGGTTQYLYGNPDDDTQVTAVRDPSGVLTWYHYDDGGRLLALQRGASRYYVATDATGSPRVVADASGTVVRRQRWDAFGMQLEDTAPGFHLALGFAGGLADPITDLVRFGLRDYEPASGRWTSRDPLLFNGAQGNLYAYVGNHPVGLVDRSGLVSGEIGVYDGVGADAKFSLTGEGFSACFGFGFGAGGTSIGLDPFGDLDEDRVALEVRVKGQLGPARGELGFDISECANVKPKAEACLGLLCTKFDKGKPNVQVKGNPKDLTDGLMKSLLQEGTGFRGKAGAKICQQVKW